MASSGEETGSAPPELGTVLALLHDAALARGPVEVRYQVWQREPPDRANTNAERGEIVQIWRDGEKLRIEHHGGPVDGSYALVDPPSWWWWHSYTSGARTYRAGHSNNGDPDRTASFGVEFDRMLDPAWLLGALRFQPTRRSYVAGRPTLSVRATPRKLDPEDLRNFPLQAIAYDADTYELEVDAERGVLLALSAAHGTQPCWRAHALAISFARAIPAERFRFKPPPGETMANRVYARTTHEVTLPEAQRRTHFTVLMPDRVPAGWQATCRLHDASKALDRPASVSLSYSSADGHESFTAEQCRLGDDIPFGSARGEEGWEDLTRAGQALRARPADWGQAQVQFERNHTFVFLRSDNLTRDQLADLAAGMREAPTTSSV